jgi:hypothetical protein
MLRLTQAGALYRDMPNLLWKRQATHSISRLLPTVESCPSFQVKLSTVSTGHLSQCKYILMPVSLSVLQVITLLRILATRRSLNAIPAFCATSQWIRRISMHSGIISPPSFSPRTGLAFGASFNDCPRFCHHGHTQKDTTWVS